MQRPEPGHDRVQQWLGPAEELRRRLAHGQRERRISGAARRRDRVPRARQRPGSRRIGRCARSDSRIRRGILVGHQTDIDPGARRGGQDRCLVLAVVRPGVDRREVERRLVQPAPRHRVPVLGPQRPASAACSAIGGAGVRATIAASRCVNGSDPVVEAGDLDTAVCVDQRRDGARQDRSRPSGRRRPSPNACRSRAGAPRARR